MSFSFTRQKKSISNYDSAKSVETQFPKLPTLRPQINDRLQSRLNKVQYEFQNLMMDQSSFFQQVSQPIRLIHYSYYLQGRNNTILVKMILDKRPWLFESKSILKVSIFWKSTSNKFKYERLQSGHKQSFNHLQYHDQISNKLILYQNLQLYCNRTDQSINQFVPLTYIIDLDSQQTQIQLKQFINQFIKISMEKNNKNIWLIKPPDLNRGEGIQIFNQLSQLQEFLQIQSKASIQAKKQKRNPKLFIMPGEQRDKFRNLIITYPTTNLDNEQKNLSTINFKLYVQQSDERNDRKFVIQKYIENPLLYKQRKFDFRVWVLVDHQLKFYFFREGYIRLSSDPYSSDEDHIQNKFVHLTNNAVQQFHDEYGKLEKGNQISFKTLQEYLDSKQIELSVWDDIVPKMKDIVQTAMYSAYQSLKKCIGQYEIFGFDFMIDDKYNVWLIEANTNPCLEESSPLLANLIPRMLNDAFRITIDIMFQPIEKQQTPLPLYILQKFSVSGYKDCVNLWQHITKIIKKGINWDLYKHWIDQNKLEAIIQKYFNMNLYFFFNNLQ